MESFHKFILFLMIAAFFGGAGYLVYILLRDPSANNDTTTPKATIKDPNNGGVVGGTKVVIVDGITYSRADFPEIENKEIQNTNKNIGIAFFTFFGMGVLQYIYKVWKAMMGYQTDFKSTFNVIASVLAMVLLYRVYIQTNDTELIILYTISLFGPSLLILLGLGAVVGQYFKTAGLFIVLGILSSICLPIVVAVKSYNKIAILEALDFDGWKYYKGAVVLMIISAIFMIVQIVVFMYQGWKEYKEENKVGDELNFDLAKFENNKQLITHELKEIEQEEKMNSKARGASLNKFNKELQNLREDIAESKSNTSEYKLS